MIYFFLIALTVVVLDQYTKYLILHYVAEHGLTTRDYITGGNNIIDITYATNTGAAFSLFPDQQKLFIIITLLTLAGIFIYIYRSHDLTRFPITGLAFIFGGALGNLIDRLRFGMVIDFIDLHWKEVYHWPTFNIADSMICVGVGILFVNLFYFERQQTPVPAAVESSEQSLEK